MTDSNNTSVGGNVTTGRDFVGRDRIGGDGSPSSHVEIHTEPHRGDYSNAEILQNLQKAILGNPYNLNEPGLLKSIADLSVSMTGFHAWRRDSDAERSKLIQDIKYFQERIDCRLETTDSRISSIVMLVWATVVIVGVEAVALIWLFVQRSMLGG